MDLLSNLARSFEAVGGTLAVAFIIALAAGILAMTLVYVGSALLVLDRFARVARGWLGIALAGLAVALFATVLTTVEAIPADSVFTWNEWREAFARHLAVHVASCALFVGIAVLATRLLSQHRLASVSTTLAALGVGLSLVGAGQAPLALGAGAVAFLAAGMTRVIRRLREAHSLVTLERLLWMNCLGLLPGAVLALVPGEIEIRSRAFAAGAGLLGFLFGFVALGLIPLAIAGFVSMRRSVEWFIAIRYLVAKRRQVFISAITAICVGGIAAGVWLIIVVLSVMNGFEQTWREEILGNRAHLTVHSSFGPFTDHEEILEIVSGVPGVEAASPYLDAEGMVRGSQGQISSVRLRGVGPRTVGRVTDLEGDLVAGSLEDLRPTAGEASGDPGIIVGNHLALSLGLGIGDTLLLISPFGGPPTPLGPGPRLKRFRVVGIFQSSFYQYDEVFTYTSLEAARDFRKTGEVVDGIEARTTDHYRSVLVGQRVSEALGYPYYTRDWKEVFPAFFQALKTERVMMFLLLTMIMVVAAFVIVATLVMMIMEKSSDIAILKAMGAEDSMIERIFALEGTLIGLLGTTVGVAAGIAVTGQLPWIQQKIEAVTGIDTLPASVYQFSELPSKVDPVQVVGVAAIAMILSLGATLLPSRQGARIDPAEGLRHE
ncbi:MAG: ABC transporter permease [Deltaproteobacteria bacterium]|jgi:lipoprotein-releasing system permease protein|nr:ABC transporter permease [Deltaproteobacteria bacterium]